MLAICQKLDVRASIEEIVQLSGYQEKNGTTLLGLHDAAKAKGLQAVGMKISVEELLRVKGCLAISHLWGGHFVLVEPGEAGSVKVTDPPGQPMTVKNEELKKVYSGFALLVANDAALLPKAEPAGPDLRFDSYTWEFGVLDEGSQVEHSFKCRNMGSVDLVVTKVETSCGDCLVPVGGPQTIAAGGEGEIRALLATASQRGGVAKKLYVSSSDLISPVVQLDAIGYVKPSQVLMFPRAIGFGHPRHKETVTEEVYVPSFPEDGMEVTSVTSDSQYITATLSRGTDLNRPGYIVTAILRPDAPVGELKAKITVNSSHRKQPKAELPVTATIRGNIDLSRESFFLGLTKKGQPHHASVTVSTVAETPLRITKIDSLLDHLTVAVVPKVDGKAYVLTATLKPDTPVGNVKGDVVVHTNDPDQPEIKIPVFAYVED